MVSAGDGATSYRLNIDDCLNPFNSAGIIISPFVVNSDNIYRLWSRYSIRSFVSVCSDDNFRTKWPLTLVFGTLVHLDIIYVKVVGQSSASREKIHRRKIIFGHACTQKHGRLKSRPELKNVNENVGLCPTWWPPSKYRWHPTEGSVIPFLVPRHKVWLTPTAQAPCSKAGNMGELKTWTQWILHLAEFRYGTTALKVYIQCTSQGNGQTSCKVWLTSVEYTSLQ